jgi:hypothetical protein
MQNDVARTVISQDGLRSAGGGHTNYFVVPLMKPKKEMKQLMQLVTA